jgi:hypothetical protein
MAGFLFSLIYVWAEKTVMAKEKINILSLKSEGEVHLTERGSTIRLQADNALSALQAIARHTHLVILLNQAEVDRLVSNGAFKVTLDISNDKAGAAEAVREIHRMAMEAAPVGSKIKLGKLLGWLFLAMLAGALGFAGVVLVLDLIQGTHTLTAWQR